MRLQSSISAEISNLLNDGISAQVKPLQRAALYGLAGEIVRAIMPHTEASEAALLIQLLVALGIFMGRHSYYLVEGTRHYTNEFAWIVGASSKARKGTSWGQIVRFMRIVDPSFTLANIASGLSSGEGLIHAVRDAIEQQQPIKEKNRIVGYEPVITDHGVADKRCLVVESEFARTLKAAGRDNSTLSPVMREAYDSGSLSVLTKANAERSTDAHIGIIGHITSEELRRELSATESANGYANRFLIVYSDRSKLLPLGGCLSDAALEGFAKQVRSAQAKGKDGLRLQFDPEAAIEWERIYSDLSAGKVGLLGAITARGEAHTVRLALLYALLDGESSIAVDHLRAAQAVWDYCERSAEFIFGSESGDHIEDRVLLFLRHQQERGATRTEISNLFHGHKSSSEIGRALESLVNSGLAASVSECGNGRTTHRWFCISQARGDTNREDRSDSVDEYFNLSNSWLPEEKAKDAKEAVT